MTYFREIFLFLKFFCPKKFCKWLFSNFFSFFRFLRNTYKIPMQLPTICTHWTSWTSLKSIEKAKKNDSNHSKNYPTTSFYGTVLVPPIMPVINHFYFSRDFFQGFFFQVFYLKDYELLLRKHLSPDTCLARESTLLIWFPSLPIIAKPLEPITPAFYFCVM